MAFKFLNKVKTKKVESEEINTEPFDEDYEQPDDEFTVNRNKLAEQGLTDMGEDNKSSVGNSNQDGIDAVMERMSSFGAATNPNSGQEENRTPTYKVEDNVNLFDDVEVSTEDKEYKPVKHVKVEEVEKEPVFVDNSVSNDYNAYIIEESKKMEDFTDVEVTTVPTQAKRGIDIYNEVQPNHVVTEVPPNGLGFPEGVSVKKLNFALLDNEPLIVTEFVDSYGELSRQIEQFEDRLHLSVLPLEVCGFRLPVNNLKGHEVVTIDNVRCTSGTTRIVNGDMLNALIREIANVVKSNGTYTLDLEKEYKIDGKKYMLRTLNNFEVTKLLNGFRNFPIDYYEASNGFVKIIINPKKNLVRGGQY